MSRRWTGGIVRPTPITPTGPLGFGTAPGVWTIDQVAYWLRQGVWPIAGNLLYIEDVFSTWLYTGNGGTQTITNGIDLAGRGGLVWMKSRSGATDHALYDTARGVFFDLASNTAGAQTAQTQGLTGFLANGFSIGSLAKVNTNAATYTSWTFREQPRFFDVLFYIGNGANRTMTHNLGSVPGCIMVKRMDATADWQVYHRSLANTQYMVLNSTAAAATGATRWNSTTPTDTVFSLGTDATVNASGGLYVAYLFAHDAGGFGATGTDNVISCGSYNGNGSATGPTVTLGYEPQWLLIKRAEGGTGDWNLIDNMRGFVVGGTDAELNPNLANAESTGTFVTPTATGFQLNTTDAGYNASGSVYVYIAIRRGPMRTPTTGTSVFSPIAATGSTGTSRTVGFVADMTIGKTRTLVDTAIAEDRLRGFANSNASGASPQLLTSSTSAELTNQFPEAYAYTNTARLDGQYANTFSNVWWHFGRAPGVFDVVCYTGTGVARTVAHNLGVAPELIIAKSRSSASLWVVYSAALGATQYLRLNGSDTPTADSTVWNNTSPTSTVFTVGTSLSVSSANFVAYLFASCPGVSRVGSYTGTGATQVINCGFAAGARFVLIKRTDSTGDWYVWDSARGIVAGNDPYLLLNSTAAEVTNTDWVDTAASGFELSNAAGNLVNTNGASYIFLAIS
jgi:hypothetical protein